MCDQMRNPKVFSTFCYVFRVKITYSKNVGVNITFSKVKHSANQFFSWEPVRFRAQLGGKHEKHNENAEWGGTGYSVKLARVDDLAIWSRKNI